MYYCSSLSNNSSVRSHTTLEASGSKLARASQWKPCPASLVDEDFAVGPLAPNALNVLHRDTVILRPVMHLCGALRGLVCERIDLATVEARGCRDACQPGRGEESDGSVRAKADNADLANIRHSRARGLAVAHKVLIKTGIKPIRITPGSPWENGDNERFNGRLRREGLNAEGINTTRQVQIVINQGLRQYNHIRPHQALNQPPPSPRTLSGTGT